MSVAARDSRAVVPVAGLYREACEAELAALKPGNVGLDNPGHGMTAEEFRASARASAPALAEPGLALGERIQRAVDATWKAVGKNTNLGIVLACAPLAQATLAESTDRDLRARTAAVLAATDASDAAWTYRAIRRAAPAGLGQSERHDVHEDPECSLRQAMCEAQDRDRIAGAYCDDFAEIFAEALPRLRELTRRWGDEAWALTGTYLGLLARGPDSHIARKHGWQVAERVRERAQGLLGELEAMDTPAALADRVREVDSELKTAGINPGTCADLTVATALARRLQDPMEGAPISAPAGS